MNSYIVTSVPPLLVLVLACAAGNAQQPAATVDGSVITFAEVEARVAGELQKLEQQRHQLLEAGLQQLVEERLLAAEAEKRGVSVEQLLAQLTAERTEEVSDEQVEAFYTENQARMQGVPKERILPQIRLYLEQQQAQGIRQGFLKELRASHEVKLLLEPLRVEIALDDAVVRGASDAPVTVVEFSDFQCPACRSFNPTLSQVKASYGDKVRVAFHQYPLRDIHPQAQKAAEASLCAREQDKFWELHDAMFADQAALAVDQLKAKARELGLDGERFDSCLDSGRFVDLVQAGVDLGNRVGVSGTPTVFVNGRVVSPGRVPSLQEMTAIIDDELARRSDASGQR